MKYKNIFTSIFCVTITAIAVVLLSFNPVYASSNASKSIQVHNGDSQARTATDLTFTVQVPEYEKEGYWMESYTIGTTPPIGGTRTDTPHTNSGGHVWSVDIKYDVISIPYCVTIQIDAEATLNKWNVLEIINVKWSYENDSLNTRDASPDQGFHFHDGVELNPDNSHNTSYTFNNLDEDVSLTLWNIQFYLDSVWYEPAEQWDPIGTMIYSAAGPFELLPGDSITIPLDSIPNISSSYIYVAGEIEYQMPDFDYESREFRDGHEEDLTRSIPTLTEWGLILLALLILLAGTIAVIRRRRTVAAGEVK